MKRYEAEYKEQYVSHLTDLLVTAKTKIAQAINCDWYYSWHWPENWVPKAKENCQKRLKEVRLDLARLEQAEEMLNDMDESGWEQE